MAVTKGTPSTLQQRMAGPSSVAHTRPVSRADVDRVGRELGFGMPADLVGWSAGHGVGPCTVARPSGGGVEGRLLDRHPQRPVGRHRHAPGAARAVVQVPALDGSAVGVVGGEPAEVRVVPEDGAVGGAVHQHRRFAFARALLRPAADGAMLLDVEVEDVEQPSRRARASSGASRPSTRTGAGWPGCWSAPRGEEPTKERVLGCQGLEIGRADSATCPAELLPLPKGARDAAPTGGARHLPTARRPRPRGRRRGPPDGRGSPGPSAPLIGGAVGIAGEPIPPRRHVSCTRPATQGRVTLASARRKRVRR